MTTLLIGLLLFLGVHSVRIVADGWRTRTRARIGEGPWKGLYSVLSVAGFVLIVWGYSMARQSPTVWWTAPAWASHASALLMWISFVLLAAAYVPGNALKVAIGHPMVASVKLWAFAHLLANGTAADALMFGSFLVWAVLSFRAARGRDRAQGTVYVRGPASRTVVTLLVGTGAWAGFAFWAHAALIGVRPFG